MDVEDLALGTLELLLLPHVVPELGLGDDGVLGEDSQGEHRRVGLCVGGVPPAEDEVLPDLCERGDTFIWRLESAGSWAAFLVILTMEIFIKIFPLSLFNKDLSPISCFELVLLRKNLLRYP